MASDLTEEVRLVVEVPLSRGRAVALVDPADLPIIETYEWSVLTIRNLQYATSEGQGRRFIYMHRLILAAPAGLEVDHRNHDGLDNRRSNLRLATPAQNRANQRPKRGGSSRFRGVSWCKERRLWEVQSHVDGRKTHLGRYADEEEAARAHDAFALARWGEFAYLNFPGDSPAHDRKPGVSGLGLGAEHGAPKPGGRR